MRDSITAYLEYCSTLGYSKRTIGSYRERLQKFRKYSYEHKIKLIRNVSIELVRSYHEHLIDIHFKPTSLMSYLNTLSNYLQWSYQHNLILSDLSQRMEKIPKVYTLPPQPLTEDDIVKLLKSLPIDGIVNKRNKAIIELFYATGIRKSELVNLNVKDIDFERRLILVHGKGDKERLLPVHERALDSITAYLSLRKGKVGKNTPLFLSHHQSFNDNRISGILVNKIFDSINKIFHKHIYPHLLRHTFALHMLSNGIELLYLMRLLGHSSPETSSRYLRYSTSEIKRLYDQGIDFILNNEQDDA